MTNNWTAQQLSAIDQVRNWIDSGRPVFRLWGFAGTGKTTLLKHLTANNRTCVVAYTGKAALVLRNKGCPGASTIHSLIYRAIDKIALRIELQALRRKQTEDGELSPEELRRLQEIATELARPSFVLNEAPFSDPDFPRANDFRPPRPDLIAIDEASMVDKRIAEDLLSFDIPLLVVADPAQLPPIEGAGYFTSNAAPDVMLDEIHRQAWDSGIIRMATEVRQRKPIRGSFGTDAQITNKMPKDWLDGAQLLCGRNVTRRNYNHRARAALGFANDGLPVAGDKLCCWRNNHSEGLLNGSLWRVLEAVYPANPAHPYFSLHLRSEDDSASERVCLAHKRPFTEPDPYKQWDWQERQRSNEFDYGYALTVHKAQGSQWDKVILVDESWCFREHKHNWLYTGVTRAAKELVVIR